MPRLAWILLVLLVAGAPSAAHAQTPVEEAQRLTAAYHEDPTRIDRARDLLEQALARDRRVETMIALSRVYLLVGDVRARTPDEKLAAFARGRELGKRATELLPKSEDAHFWYVANTGRWGQTKGVVRSLFLLPTVREELDILFALNPRSARTHNVAANVLFEVPGLLGGDRTKAEEHWKKGIEIDPRYTLLRVDYAKLLIATGRYDEARRELRRVLDEPAPTNRADWTMRDAPRARTLLDQIKDKR
ncbi:MAG: tetratricopeptide repeat protein [Candidatus Rokubacteria bacterium]|nr:tetratricopeptide repeat protein [Candidatus Rokubacteria bacterium]